MNETPALSLEVLDALTAVEARLEEALEPLGLSLAKFRALSRLVVAGEPLPLSTLAEKCACVRSNITQLMDRLEGESLVTRAHDPHDRRLVRASITEEGLRRQAEGERVIQRLEEDLFASVPLERRATFRELLGSLRKGC